MNNLFIFFFIVSCKTDKTHSPQQKNDDSVKTSVEVKDEIQHQDLEFYNKVENLGIGLLKAKGNQFYTYNDSSLSTNKKKEGLYNPKNVKPIFFKPDYNIFYLTCLIENETYYTINNGNKIYLNKDDFEFYTWETFFENTTGIGSIDWKLNPILNKPDGDIIDLDINDDFIAVEKKGDWLKIRNNALNTGWIKWRFKNKLLIEVYLLI